MSEGSVQDAYDLLAARYDEDFSDGRIAAELRAQFRERLEPHLPGNGRLLDLGCGTGEDAIHYAARGYRVDGVDISSEMIDHARDRVGWEGLEDRVQLEVLPIEQLDQLDRQPYDVVYSNFAALNCVEDLESTVAEIVSLVRPGGLVALSLMNRRCVWETLLFPLTWALHRRIRQEDNDWQQIPDEETRNFPMTFPSVREIAEAFRPELDLIAAPGIGFLTPPTYLEPFAQVNTPWMRWFARVDRTVGDLPAIRAWADHRLVLLRRG